MTIQTNNFNGHSKSREVFPFEMNLAASESSYENLDKDVPQHAHVRPQLFYLQAMAYFGKACRSDGTVADVTVTVHGATMQVGKGNKKNHAAHANAAAKLSDNYKENMIKDIIKQGLTPQKTKVLKAKGLTQRNLNKINANFKNAMQVEEIVNSKWPQDSLLDGTELELTLNITHFLPQPVNLSVDCPLEKKIRKYIGVLLTKVVKGELNPNRATSLFINRIQELFDEKIIKTEEKIETTSGKKLKKLQKNLDYAKLERTGSIEFDYSYLNKDFVLPNSQEMDVEATMRLLKPLNG